MRLNVEFYRVLQYGDLEIKLKNYIYLNFLTRAVQWVNTCSLGFWDFPLYKSVPEVIHSQGLWLRPAYYQSQAMEDDID